MCVFEIVGHLLCEYIPVLPLALARQMAATQSIHSFNASIEYTLQRAYVQFQNMTQERNTNDGTSRINKCYEETQQGLGRMKEEVLIPCFPDHFDGGSLSRNQDEFRMWMGRTAFQAEGIVDREFSGGTMQGLTDARRLQC